ncbi:MAG TPA: hypothetical protein VIY28_04625 [Pseudonocardiaceae bacterium]
MSPRYRCFGPASTAARSAPIADTARLVADAAITLAMGAARTGSRVIGLVTHMLRPLTDLAARPHLLPRRYRAMQADLEALNTMTAGVDRESTGSLSSEAARGGRIQSIEVDEAVAAWADRVYGPRR